MKNFPIVICKKNNHVHWHNFDRGVQAYCLKKKGKNI